MVVVTALGYVDNSQPRSRRPGTETRQTLSHRLLGNPKLISPCRPPFASTLIALISGLRMPLYLQLEG
jgi:hypothetical protein